MTYCLVFWMTKPFQKGVCFKMKELDENGRVVFLESITMLFNCFTLTYLHFRNRGIG